jgi:hypothetical protein
MTTSVTINVPPHVHAVIVRFEDYRVGEGWVDGDTKVIYGPAEGSLCITDDRRIVMVVERTKEEMEQGRPLSVQQA